MTDKEIKKALECYRGRVLFAFNGKKPEIYIHDIIDLINRLEADKKALIAGQETLQKALAEKQAEIEKQSQNLKVLVPDHRTLQQIFDNLKGLYEDEKAKVEKTKEKSIYFAKKLQTAKANNERLKRLLAEEEAKYSECAKRFYTEGVKEFAEKLKERAKETVVYKNELCVMGLPFVNVKDIDSLIKEMVGE